MDIYTCTTFGKSEIISEIERTIHRLPSLWPPLPHKLCAAVKMRKSKDNYNLLRMEVNRRKKNVNQKPDFFPAFVSTFICGQLFFSLSIFLLASANIGKLHNLILLRSKGTKKTFRKLKDLYS